MGRRHRGERSMAKGAKGACGGKGALIGGEIGAAGGCILYKAAEDRNRCRQDRCYQEGYHSDRFRRRQGVGQRNPATRKSSDYIDK